MSYTAASQVVARQLEFFENRKVLVVGELSDSFPLELTQVAKSVAVFTTNYGYHRSMNRHSQIQSYFGGRAGR